MKPTAAVERWLVKQTLSEAFLNVPVGTICLAASLVVLALTSLVASLVGLVLFTIFASFAKSAFDINLHDPISFCEIFCAAFLSYHGDQYG